MFRVTLLFRNEPVQLVEKLAHCWSDLSGANRRWPSPLVQLLYSTVPSNKKL